MTGEEIQKMQTTYTMQSWSKQKGLKPIPVERSEGIYFYDTDGKRYADMSSQQVNVNLGYGQQGDRRRHQGKGGQVLLHRAVLRR